MDNIKKLTYAGLLTALAIIIPTAFGFLKIQLGPFSATLASHVPMFLSMFLGPVPAVIVGIGSAVGFLITSPAVIAARASSHIFVGLLGAVLLKKGVSFKKVIALTAPVHAILEAIFVIPFGFTMFKVLVVVGAGTFAHHIVDGVIAFTLVSTLARTLKVNLGKA
ncbi:MAG: ECF transporter S component [Clostridium sp.]|jgi:niacin transporter|uniref:ECF transporter S component n=1 Tax=Clostridium sp. TaxID=1506 RepID=UPI0025B9491B|nr:ECF transporter S component [Clostridium sp.]MCH3963885.1 ECF transporter S component [Clostridium sp.]MCI1717004.1 ECF transporter S component [Clostridium sp.]MCI1801277.1 ECF transporter S component [Clostridium sp.]MCI1815123.1 ECF transporter S component [Clostridium sp.]MCI1872093.1 ECF transporter S component [Clostridium sp.]